MLFWDDLSLARDVEDWYSDQGSKTKIRYHHKVPRQLSFPSFPQFAPLWCPLPILLSHLTCCRPSVPPNCLPLLSQPSVHATFTNAVQLHFTWHIRSCVQFLQSSYAAFLQHDFVGMNQPANLERAMQLLDYNLILITTYLLDNLLCDWMIKAVVHFRHMKPIKVTLVEVLHLIEGCKVSQWKK